jgi:hypothetical protein
MSSDKDLAIINPAQSSAVLPTDPGRSATFFGKACALKNQDSVIGTCMGSHVPGTEPIHLSRVPISASQNFLQSLPTDFWQRSADLRSCLSARPRQKPGSVTLKALPALRSAQKLAKRDHELFKINQRLSPCW